MPNVISINISRDKHTMKYPVDEARLIEDHGFEGDAHAAPGDRQVSLLAKESYERFEKMRQSETCLKEGSFGENIITEGIELHKLPIGTKLQIGPAVVVVTKIGKECHAPCAIGKEVGRCIMPEEGIFVGVLKGGTIRSGDMITFI